MNEFMSEDFVLENDIAKDLYFSFAKGKPIYDFHNHLSAKEIYENKNYENIAKVWLGCDHYKWRAMRANGIKEDLITGNSSDYDKYMAWAETVPRLIGSPLYHWNHLEMQKYFDYNKPLSPDTAKEFWDIANNKLQSDKFRPRELLVKMNVFDMCTTDDPIDDLKYHKILQKEEKRFSVRPTFRPEKAMAIEKGEFNIYINKLQEKVGFTVDSYGSLCDALELRMEYFETVKCNISDHSLEGFVFEKPVLDINQILNKRLSGEELSYEEIKQYKSSLMLFLAKEYHRRNWVMQLHIGALRNNSTRRYESIGVDIGCDCADDISYASQLSKLLDMLDYSNELPKTIIYNLNDKDTFMLGTLIGNFQAKGIKSKIQLGAGWWFLDNRSGIEKQLKTFAEQGTLANFVGMVTDSRSLLSFPRHEYFRRILCNYIGSIVERGEYPYDRKNLEEIIEGICYKNIVKYLE